MTPETANLHFQSGSSDKVYNVDLVHNTLQGTQGWAVNIAYGRRGSSLNSSQKKGGLEYEPAKKLFDKLVKAKMAKGYELVGGGNKVQVVEKEKTGMYPQLANPLPWDEIVQLHQQWDSMYVQEKYDGERRMVRLGIEAVAGNRTGFRTTLNEKVQNEVNQLCFVFPGWKLDCEDCGEYLYVFDVVDSALPFEMRRERLKALDEYIGAEDFHHIIVDPGDLVEETGVYSLVECRKDAEECLAEGLIFRNGNAKYIPGRPASGGDLIKFKFVASCTVVVVEQHETKRSVKVAVRGGAEEYPPAHIIVGNVTIPPNYAIPSVGTYIEVEYLYAYPNGGSLYQPQYKGPRTDKIEADAYLSLKFKRSAGSNQ